MTASEIDDARAFIESETGQRLMREEPYLPAILDDHDARTFRSGWYGGLVHASTLSEPTAVYL